MKNFIQPGDVLEFTAPAGGVVSGDAVQIGDIIGVASNTVAATERFNMAVTGVYEVTKLAGEAYTEGQLIYWDDTAKNVTTTAATNNIIGVSTAVALSAAVVATIRLDGVAS